MKKGTLFSTLFVLFIALFTIKGAVVIDPDLGWHIKVGEIILKTGRVPATDPFSYTMSNFPFIDHSWLMSLGVALLYPAIGLWGISFVFALMGVGAYTIQYALLKNKGAFPLFISLFVCLSFVGIRSQTSTLLFFSILLLLLNQSKKIQLFIIPLMLLWVNLHGGFFIGIITLVIYAATEGIKLKKISSFHLILSVLGLLISVCNPYGVQIWKEVLLTSTDLMVRASITEWMPAFFYINIPFWIYTGFIIVLAIKYGNMKENLFYLVLGTFLLTNAFVGMRHIPLWLLTTFYMWGQYYPRLKQDSARNKTTQARFDKAKRIAIYTIAAACFIQSIFYIQSITSSIEAKMYPVGALKYLMAQKKEGNLFALYGWGGYIIWKTPEEKTFIDGRMPIWNWDNKNTHFLLYAYADYLNILGGRVAFEHYRAKYHIAHVLMPTKNSKNTGKNIFSSYPIEYADETATLYNTK